MHFSQKVWEIETLFVLQTYRKSYMGFYLVPWPLTSDAPNDLEMSNMHFSRKPWEIETSVVLESYRKSYMNFLLMPWPLISDAPNDLKHLISTCVTELWFWDSTGEACICLQMQFYLVHYISLNTSQSLDFSGKICLEVRPW